MSYSGPIKVSVRALRSGVLGLACGSLLIGRHARAADVTTKLTNTYAAQQKSYYCGAASALMMLNSSTVNTTPLPSQDSIYNKILTNNDANSSNVWIYADPVGVRGAVANYDPPANGRNYIAYQMTDFNAATRTLAYNIYNYKVPGSVMTGPTSHWVDVYGVKTDVAPALAGANKDFQVKSIYVKDPWSGYWSGLTKAQQKKYAPGFGQDAELQNTADGKGLWNQYFTKLSANYVKDNTKAIPNYVGKYDFVTDPDEDDDSASTAPTFSGSTITDNSTASSDAMSDITNDTNGGDDGDLSTIPAFENGSFGGTGEEELSDSFGNSDWIVPYYQTGDITDPSAIAVLDPDTGGLEGAFWNDDGTDLSLEDFEDAMQGPTGLTPADNVPEPASAALLLIAGGLAITRRRRRA